MQAEGRSLDDVSLALLVTVNVARVSVDRVRGVKTVVVLRTDMTSSVLTIQILFKCRNV